jgi:hypothetical protein
MEDAKIASPQFENPEGRRAGRLASRISDQARNGDQPQNREGNRPHSAAFAARSRRRGDRITLAASAFDRSGHERTQGVTAKFATANLYCVEPVATHKSRNR